MVNCSLRANLLGLFALSKGRARLRSRRRLYLSAILFVLITVGGACLAIRELYRDRIADEQVDTHNLAIAMAAQTARTFQAIDLVLRETGDMVRASGATDPGRFRELMASEKIHRYLVDHLRSLPQLDALTLIDATGQIVNFSREWPVPAIDTVDRDFYAYWRSHDDAGVFIGAPVINKVTGAWVLTVTRRIDGPNGELLGIALGVIDLRYFEDFYREIRTSEGESLSLFRRDGMLLARHPRVDSMIGEQLSRDSPWYADVERGGGTYRTPGYIDGTPRIVSVETVEDYPLAITVGITEAVALAPWGQQSLLIAMGALGAIIGFAILLDALATQVRNLETNEARFRGFAETSSDWFWETDKHHRISYMSEGVSTTGFGVKPSALVGRTRMEIAADAGRELDKWREHYEMLERHEPFRDFSYTWVNPGGQGTASISGDPLFDERGEFLGYRGTGRDITPLKLAEMQLRQTQEDLNRAQRMAKVGTDVWDLQTGEVTWSEQIYRIFGVDPTEFVPSHDAFLNLVVPEDRPTMVARGEEIRAGKSPPAWEFRIRRPDAEIRRIYSEAELVLDENGKPLRWVGMRQDVTEQRRAEREMREAKEAAEAANLAKSQFLANMSHELRTPLNAIIGFSEMIEQGFAGSIKPRQREYIGLVLQSGRHLLNVINDILDLAKVDAGKLELHAETELDPAPVIDSCLTLVRGQASVADVHLSATVEPGLPRFSADPTRLKQILLNLLSNAIKFTPQGGAVTVTAKRGDAGELRFEVRDTGIGMSADDIEIAFQPFGQVESDDARRYQGTGLGLPLARRLAELHGGFLEVESEPGRGTCVIVTLPASRIAPVASLKPGAKADAQRPPVRRLRRAATDAAADS